MKRNCRKEIKDCDRIYVGQTKSLYNQKNIYYLSLINNHSLGIIRCLAPLTLSYYLEYPDNSTPNIPLVTPINIQPE